MQGLEPDVLHGPHQIREEAADSAVSVVAGDVGRERKIALGARTESQLLQSERRLDHLGHVITHFACTSLGVPGDHITRFAFSVRNERH